MKTYNTINQILTDTLNKCIELEDNFICQLCKKSFHKTEQAKETKQTSEYFCQKCWDED